MPDNNNEQNTAFVSDDSLYGKKVNKHMLIGLIVFVISLIISIVMSFVIDEGLTIETFDNNVITFNLNLVCYLFYIITMITAFALVYLDGKRDGAIMQFKNK